MSLQKKISIQNNTSVTSSNSFKFGKLSACCNETLIQNRNFYYCSACNLRAGACVIDDYDPYYKTNIDWGLDATVPEMWEDISGSNAIWKKILEAEAESKEIWKKISGSNGTA